jgi:hypothetical protein
VSRLESVCVTYSRAELGSNLEVGYIRSFMVVSGHLGCPEPETD